MDIIKTFNPANHQITPEEISAMRELTDEQIEQLSKAYPNQPSGNAYLVYYMKHEKENEQRYPLGTWANLHALRKLGRNDVLPFHFHKLFFAQKSTKAEPVKQRVVDLSPDDIKGAEGLKVNEMPGTTAIVNAVQKPVPTILSAPFAEGTAKESVELTTAKAELQQAIDDKAHHMIIKKLQKTVDELETKINIAV